MEPRPLRVAYAIEFLISLVAFFECWSQVGGQTPLDLMPWWLKLLFAVLFGSVLVGLTGAAVRNERFPPIALIRWGIGMIAVLVIVALTTYYFHLNEPQDEDSGDESVTSSAIFSPVASS